MRGAADGLGTVRARAAGRSAVLRGWAASGWRPCVPRLKGSGGKAPSDPNHSALMGNLGEGGRGASDGMQLRFLWLSQMSSYSSLLEPRFKEWLRWNKIVLGNKVNTLRTLMRFPSPQKAA